MATDPTKKPDFAHIGKSVFIKGELSGSEDLYVDGQVEGTINLLQNSLTVGPNGQVRADIHAKNLVVQGKVEGSIEAADRAQLTKTAIVVADVSTQRLAIEEGAYLKGKVEMLKGGDKASAKAASEG
jgi:cytoskeletal protein CcmA (bactofilin family)